jgi:hypothetical protein
LIIEPLVNGPIAALATKEHRILRLAWSRVHFELPAKHLFYWENARRAYTNNLAELVNSITALGSESKIAALAP